MGSDRKSGELEAGQKTTCEHPLSSTITLKQRPRSVWNAVHDHAEMPSTISLKCRPRWA